MNKYPLYESRMKSYGLENMTIEDMIAQGMITEERIAEIEKELQTASAFETVSPIGYAYNVPKVHHEKRITHYIIHFSREVNLHYPFLPIMSSPNLRFLRLFDINASNKTELKMMNSHSILY